MVVVVVRHGAQGGRFRGCHRGRIKATGRWMTYCEKRKASRGTARRSVPVRLDLIDSVARSLSMFLAVPDRACSPQITLFCVSFFSQRVLRATVRPRWRF